MDSPGALSREQRATLAAWADEGDIPPGFADRVVVAFLAERVDLDEDEAVSPEPRAKVGEARLVRVVGIITAMAAAAAVMLMVRVLPRASEVEVAAARTCEHVGAGRERGLEPSRSEPSAASACETGAEPLPPEPRAEARAGRPEPNLAVLGAQAATVLAQHCSPCHDSTDFEANPNALQVFDLEQPQWWLTMSDAQLEEARTRVQQLGAATEDERRRVAAFVEVQLRQRAHAG